MTNQTPPASELERAYLEPEPFQLQDEVTSLTRDLSTSAGLFQRSLDMIGRLQEQLAQMKSERDQYDELHLDSIALASKYKAQLADVLHTLDQHRAWTGMGWEQLPVPVHAVEKIRSKLAQAEQQEAKGAQAGDERAAFEEWAHKNWPGAERKMLERDAQGSYVSMIYRDYFTGWKARAALATQPATKVECPDRALKKALFACVNAGSEPRTYGGVLTSGGYAWVRFTVEPAVRGAEHDQ